MAESSVNHPEMEPLQPANVSYLLSDTLFIQTDKPFIEGEEIAQGVTVFYGKKNPNEVVGVMIDGAEAVLKPFVDAILTKRSHSESGGVSRDERLTVKETESGRASPIVASSN